MFNRNYGYECHSNNFTKTMQNIINDWKLDAKCEDERFFYYRKEVEALKNGSKCYVIGRKGMGKSAICENICRTASNMEFTDSISFKNFPFAELYSFDDKTYTRPNQYISIWMYIIYNSVCKLMSKNEGLDSSILVQLRKVYTATDSKVIEKLIRHWTAKEFSFSVMGNGLSFAGDESQTDETQEQGWVSKLEILEKIIMRYSGDCSYYILIDELDEDYKVFDNEKEKKDYIELLTGLFKAVQKIKGAFLGTNVKIRPIIFLRTDIYDQISDSDKNKWSDFLIQLKWTDIQLKEMLVHRIKQCMDFKIPDKNIWDSFFQDKYITMGTRQRRNIPVFDFITRSTHLRPRDYIYYIKESSRIALENNEIRVGAKSIKRADDSFSDYFKRELLDEVTPVMSNIMDILSVLSQIRKQTFSPHIFIDEYKKIGKSEDEAKKILIQLFDFGIIGNQPSMKSKQIYIYQSPGSRFNFNEHLIIHRGLYKSLQIY